MKSASQLNDGKAIQALIAQLLVKDQSRADVLVVEQTLPASVYYRAVAAANRLAKDDA